MRRARGRPPILVATPVKNAAEYLETYFGLLAKLSYPADRISLGFLESDSTDGTYAALERRLRGLRRRYRRVGLWKHDFGVDIPTDEGRWAMELQPARRAVIARSRNHLLSHALDDEEWVFWVDVDKIEAPADLLDRLLATGKEIVQPHCVLLPGGQTFDRNGWRDHGRYHLDDFRGGDDLVRLDAVGGTMLLVRADLHRDGLHFPPVPYGVGHPLSRPGQGEVETEGLGILAHDMGVECWGMPNLEVRHRYPY
jgi:peptide chain release factor subunit 1